MDTLPSEVRLPAAFLLGLLITLALTPLVRRAAVLTAFYDHPKGYKAHSRPTPYLGGLAVMAGVLIAAILFADALDHYLRLIVCALVLLVLGTVDDRLSLGVAPRVAAQVAAAVALWNVDLGWNVFSSEAANLTVTVVWLVGLSNAFNLMDNQDGAAATVAAVCAGGAGTLAAIEGDVLLAALALSVSGACAGFLPHNLARPSRIFLGDGGSTPVGFLVAASIMAIPDETVDWDTLLALAPLAGLPILDTALVVVSRLRRGVRVFSGGRDHITHRLLRELGTERRVAVALAVAQAMLCAAAIALYSSSRAVVVAGAMMLVLAGAWTLLLLETSRWSSGLPERSA